MGTLCFHSTLLHACGHDFEDCGYVRTMGENLALHEHVRIPAHHGSAALRSNGYKDK